MIVPYSLSLPLSLSLSRSLVLTLPRSLARSLSGLAQASVGAHVPPQGRSHALDGLRFNEDHIVNDHLDHPLSDHTEISATERPCRLYHPIPPSATTQETPHTALEYTRQPACRGLRFGVRRRRCVTTREVARRAVATSTEAEGEICMFLVRRGAPARTAALTAASTRVAAADKPLLDAITCNTKRKEYGTN